MGRGEGRQAQREAEKNDRGPGKVEKEFHDFIVAQCKELFIIAPCN